MRSSPIVLAVLALLALTRPAAALEDAAFAAPVAQALSEIVLPSYEALAEAADAQHAVMEALCGAPDAGTLDAARAAFTDLVAAFSRVEMFRFGPARTDNRFDRLFFWPDRRGRGLKQVQEVLAGEDAGALSTDGLLQKSVAVQGLLALEYVLYGKGGDSLASGADYRCRYGEAIASVVAVNAGAILEEWKMPGGFAEAMNDAGPDDPVFKSHAESLQALLKAAGEMLEIVRDSKIGSAVGDGDETSKPKRAPFWRSDLTLATMAANVEAVNALHGALDLGPLLPGEWKTDSDQVRFELDHAAAALADVDAAPGDFLAAAGDPDTAGKLRYAAVPLGSAIEILTGRYPAALGLALGFNALDGD